jgi:hypothetical protein
MKGSILSLGIDGPFFFWAHARLQDKLSTYRPMRCSASVRRVGCRDQTQPHLGVNRIRRAYQTYQCKKGASEETRCTLIFGPISFRHVQIVTTNSSLPLPPLPVIRAS